MRATREVFSHTLFQQKNIEKQLKVGAQTLTRLIYKHCLSTQTESVDTKFLFLYQFLPRTIYGTAVSE